MSIKVEFWSSHFVTWRDSGLSQAAYCRQHGLSLPCFGYWRGKLRTLREPVPVSPSLAKALLPIVVCEVAMPEARLDVTLLNGLQLHLPIDMDVTRWVPMIQALMAC